MNMGRWQALAIVTALAVAAVPAVAQGDFGAPRPEMAEAPVEAAQLYEDVQILRTVRTLNLSAEQQSELLRMNVGINAERENLADMRQDIWAEYQDEIQSVLDAWTDGETPASGAKSAADRAVNRVTSARNEFQNARWNVAEALYDSLSADQREMVESPGVAERRAARTARMGGTESVGRYVLTELDAIRDLMPDEFEMLAATEAQRIAQAIVGPDGNVGQMADGVLDILLQVYGWSPDRYRNQRETLPEQIEAQLGVGGGPAAPVSWTELMRLATSDRTAAAIEMLGSAEGDEVE
jgi:hypothetical protein